MIGRLLESCKKCYVTNTGVMKIRYGHAGVCLMHSIYLIPNQCHELQLHDKMRYADLQRQVSDH